MRLLLDTHIALWWASDRNQLSIDVIALIGDPSTEAYVSVVSAWELAIKAAQGRIDLDVRLLFAALSTHQIRSLGISVDDTHRAANLDWAHRDPFDRMLIAQALRLDGAIVTRDREIIDADLIVVIAA